MCFLWGLFFVCFFLLFFGGCWGELWDFFFFFFLDGLCMVLVCFCINFNGMFCLFLFFTFFFLYFFHLFGLYVRVFDSRLNYSETVSTKCLAS